MAGGGYGISFYRALQKREVPFATGILFENDVDCQVATELSNHVVAAPAFEAMTDEHFGKASSLLLQCEAVIDAGTPAGSFNRLNLKLLELAENNSIPIHCGKSAAEAHSWNT